MYGHSTAFSYGTHGPPCCSMMLIVVYLNQCYEPTSPEEQKSISLRKNYKLKLHVIILMKHVARLSVPGSKKGLRKCVHIGDRFFN